MVALSLLALISFVEFLHLESQQRGLSFTLALMRSYFLLVQSSWFIQIGVMLFVFAAPSVSSTQLHARLMNLTSGFSLHLFFDVFIVLAVSWVGQMLGGRVHTSVTDSTYTNLPLEHMDDRLSTANHVDKKQLLSGEEDEDEPVSNY